jgi:hypothetical protein
MLILSYGVKKPETGDKGSVFFPALEFDMQYLNDHVHDGVTGAPIPADNIVAAKQTLLAANWVVSGSIYRQLVTVVNSKGFDDMNITFKDAATSQDLLLATEKASTTTYYVYCNDPSIDVNVYYRG